MRKSVFDRLKVFGSVDTRFYRYVLEDCGSFSRVIRCPLSSLGTTAVFSDWEVVSIDNCLKEV